MSFCDERYVFASAGIVAGTLTATLAWAITRRRIRSLRLAVLAAKKEGERAVLVAERDLKSAKKYGNSNLLKDILVSVDNLDRCVLHSSSSGSSSSSNNNNSSNNSNSSSGSNSNSSSSTSTAQIMQGLQLTQKELLKVLSAHGVNLIPVEQGSAFNPELMEAMMQQQLPQPPPLPLPPGDCVDGTAGCMDTTDANADSNSGVSSSSSASSSSSSAADAAAKAAKTARIISALDAAYESADAAAADSNTAKAGTVSQVLVKGYTFHDRVLRPAKVAVYVE
jgi:molecular chaperone GrpE (heat shock protein)